MLGEVFYWVLNMSIAGAMVGCILLCLRKIKKIPRGVVYVLWLLPLVRLLIPVGVGSKFSFMNFLDKFAVKTVVVWEEAPVDMLISNYIGGAQRYSPFTYKTNILEYFFYVAFVVWLLMGVIGIVITLVLYSCAKKKLKIQSVFQEEVPISYGKDSPKNMSLQRKIYLCNNIRSPVVLGICRPKILLPPYLLKNEDLNYILFHENVHIKRKDNFWRIVAVITCCFHWFNPFVWLFFKYFLEDMELSCDERVLKEYGIEKKKAYATAILNVEMEKNLFVSAFGGANTRLRIEKILSYKRVTIFSGICFGILIGIMTIVLLTNAAI